METTYRQPNDHIKSDVISFLILRHKESTVHARKGGNYFRKFATFRKINTEKEAFSFHSIEFLISLFTVLYGPKGKYIRDTNNTMQIFVLF